MKVYVLTEFVYCEGENEFYISKISYSRETAVQQLEQHILSNIKTNDDDDDHDFIIDENYSLQKIKLNEKNFIRLFYDYQENWENYIEYEILEREIEF